MLPTFASLLKTLIQTTLILCLVKPYALADVNPTPPSSKTPTSGRELQTTIYDILASALEETVLDNLRVSHELEALRARDSALGIILLSPSQDQIQQRTIDLLRQAADLKQQNQQLQNTIDTLLHRIQNAGLVDIEILDAVENIRSKNISQKLLIAAGNQQISTTPLTLHIIAKDGTNGWFIANGGWDAGITEGMIYSFNNPEGTTGYLRIIETRKNVCALIPQIGSPLPTIGQKLTLQTR